MPLPHLGELLALLSPMAWTFGLVLFKRTGASPVSMNLFKNAVAMALLTLSLFAIGDGFPMDRSGWDWLRLVTSGFLGLSIADTLLFEGLRRIDATRVAAIDNVYAPLVVLLSWLFLGEWPTGSFLIGAALVVVGIAVTTVRPGALSVSSRHQWVGVLYVLIAISCTAAGVVLAKPVLEHSSLIEVTWTRLFVGIAGQGLFIVVLRQGGEAFTCFRPSRSWWTLLPASFFGAYLCLILWLGGFKWADASVAAVLNQMGTVYLLILARVILGEHGRLTEILGALVAAAGALYIVISRL